MANHIDRWDISSDDDYTFTTLFDGFDYILDSPLECFASVEVAGEFEYFLGEGLVGKRVGDWWEVELLGLLLLHIVENGYYYQKDRIIENDRLICCMEITLVMNLVWFFNI